MQKTSIFNESQSFLHIYNKIIMHIHHQFLFYIFLLYNNQVATDLEISEKSSKLPSSKN